jgi:hypothetical protein
LFTCVLYQQKLCELLEFLPSSLTVLSMLAPQDVLSGTRVSLFASSTPVYSPDSSVWSAAHATSRWCQSLRLLMVEPNQGMVIPRYWHERIRELTKPLYGPNWAMVPLYSSLYFIPVEYLLYFGSTPSSRPYLAHAASLASAIDFTNTDITTIPAVTCQIPSVNVPLPDSWLPLSVGDFPAVVETSLVLQRDGMSPRDSLNAARRLVA